MRIKRFAILAAMLAAPLFVAAAPPVDEYTALPKYDSLAISPGGTHLAFTQREGDNASLTIVDFPSMKVNKTISFGVRTDIDEIFWVDEKRLLMQPARFAPEFKAYKIRTGEIVRVDVETGKVDLIFGFLADMANRGTHVSKREATNMPGQVLSMKTGDPDEVLIETVGAGMGEYVNAAYRMNLKSGKLDMVAASPVRGSRFVTGEDRRVSVLIGVNDEGETVVYHLPGKGKPGCCAWTKKIATRDEDGDFYPVAWAGKGEVYYAIDNRDAPTRGVFLWDAEANTQRLLYRHPEADLYPAAADPAGRPWLFAGSDNRPIYWYPDPDHPLARMHQTLTQGLPQDQVNVVSETDDLSIAVVRIDSARRPPTYLVVDVRSAKPLQVMPTHPGLKAQDMAPVSPIGFAARDGRNIRGYLTTPLAADGKPGRKLPTVVVVHGGPFGVYDDYSYDFERQLFASRGYAVLQVNFRGSGGRGREFTRAGYGEWGRAIQDDITDGVRWAIQEGVADASRICIYGGSFGAYSALVGVSREPTMFKCAVGMAGVYDLPLLYERGDVEKSRRGVNYLKDAVGDDEKDLQARSPVYSAKSITAKVMLLHGADDFRAPLEHAKRMREALIEAGNPPEWIVEGGEDHGFSNPDNRVSAYTRILEFIDGNIGH